MCTDKPLVLVDKGSCYRWAFERLGLEYRHERFGMRNRVERFFRYLKKRTAVFHHEERKRPHTGNKQPKAIPKPIHNILSSREGEVSKNAYLDTISIRLLRVVCGVIDLDTGEGADPRSQSCLD
jgi:hypothetical protein